MIRGLARPLERELGQPGLGDFLSAVAYTESRGNSDAVNASTGARGWFQILPTTALLEQRGLPVSALQRATTSVALATDLIARLRKYAAPGQVVDWAAIRRGWAYPSLVDDVQLTQERSRQVQARLEAALRAVGLPLSFSRMPAFPPGYSYPGFAAVLSTMVSTTV